MKTSMRMEWTFVTPAMASVWLARNAKNRTIKSGVVDRYARDVAAGRFMPTHQGIGIYEDGELADGQHRLSAIVQSGQGVWMFVCHGVPLASRLAIDGVVSRSTFDRLTIAGTDATRKMIEIANLAQKLGDGPKAGKLTGGEMQAYLDFYGPAMRFAAEAMACKTRNLTIAPIGVVLFRAWYTADKPRLTEFAERLLSGSYDVKTDEAGLKIRNYLLTEEKATAAKYYPETYSKTENALWHFLRNLPMPKLFAARGELFPIPPMQSEQPENAIKPYPKNRRTRAA